MSLPRVVIVGRTNVGKSTLFNRLASNIKSMAFDEPGITRDVLRDTVTWQGRSFELVDTGGLVFGKVQDELIDKTRHVALQELDSADLFLFVVDGTVGVVNEDRLIAQLLHKQGKKVLMLVNKADSKRSQEYQHEALTLGFGEPLAISAQHGLGIGELLEEVIAHLPHQGGRAQEKARYRVAIIGKPNVGKSSLMNALVGSERTIVADIPGTTREAIEQPIKFYQETIMLTDTPGMRRSRSVDTTIEEMMVKSAMHALKDADIILLVLDASQGILADQELKLAFYAFTQQHKGLIVLLNKWDKVTDEIRAELEHDIEKYNHMLHKVPVMRISCATGKNVGKILSVIDEVWQASSQRIADEELHLLFTSELKKRPQYNHAQPLRLYGVRQTGIAPITIALFVNEPTWFDDAMCRFFENLLRDRYPLQGAAVKFVIRKAR
jgi:GTP-binding protein